MASCASGQGRRRILAPGEAEPPAGFYESRTHLPSNHTKLRATERIYKNKRCCLSDWPELLDVARTPFAPRVNSFSMPAPTGSCFDWRPDGCVRVCSFDGAPGLYLLPQALSTMHQQELAVHSYTTLAHPQHDCSLQRTMRLPTSRTLFQHWHDSLCPGGNRDESTVATAAMDDDAAPAASVPSLEPLPHEPAAIERALRRLRWIALGYRYNWSSLSYDWAQQPQPLPVCISRVALDTVSLLRQPPVGLQCEAYNPQAAVVNFYQIDDSLTSHVDRSEPSAAAPLVSLSLGCPAVFVFGGETRDDDTTSLLLHSGDVLVMVDSARRCFHGVPRVLHLPHALSPSPPPCSCSSTSSHSALLNESAESNTTKESSEWHLIQQLLQNSRININIRQVEA